MELRSRTWLLILAGLAVLAYLPALSQPFIADDYGNLLLARMYGPASAWDELARDPVHHYRPLFLVLTWWIERAFGLHPAAFYAASIALHVAVTWLVYALGAWRAIGWRISGPAAAFFAVYEGHQEAIMWYSAAYELLMALFGLSCVILWVLWLRAERPRPGLYLAALACFVLALFSKESGVVVLALLVLASSLRRKAVLGLLPFGVLGGAFVASVFFGAHHPRLDDGSFVLKSPFLSTFLNSFWRLFWFWGLTAAAALAVWRARQWKTLAIRSALWAGVSLTPYIFLTYMDRVPSRQTYLASVAIGWIVAAAWTESRDRCRRWLPALLAAAIIIHNISYLWVRKRSQYLERAAATEALIAAARRSPGPVYVHRFPYPRIVAEGAVVLEAGKPPESMIWAPWQVHSEGLNDYLFSLDGKRTFR